eukprot:g44562.t1
MIVYSHLVAPGGTRIDDGDRTKVTEYCVFGATEDQQIIRNYAQVFNKLIRRYKYLEKAFEDSIKKHFLSSNEVTSDSLKFWRIRAQFARSFVIRQTCYSSNKPGEPLMLSLCGGNIFPE